MDFLDKLSSGLDRLADKLDSLSGTASPRLDDSTYGVLDKEYCWEDLDYAGKYTLQRHVVEKTCRIIDQYGSVVERGPQATLEQSMVRRAAQQAALQQMAPTPIPTPTTPFSPQPTYVMPANTPQVSTSPVNPTDASPSYANSTPVQAQYGDIIGVVRKNGAYTHYGIYVSDTCVIHYAVPASLSVGHATIHPTSLKLFLRDATEYFILDFPKPYQPPVVLGNTGNHNETVSEQVARKLQQRYGYHLYSPEETVKRAKSRIGETHYNILTNNCEHFAIWCKTGVNESLQISEMLNTLTNATGFEFHRPFLWR